jgi:hypothetical protein
VAQWGAAPLTRAAIFLVVTAKRGLQHRATIRAFYQDLSALLRAVEFRDLEGQLSCVMGIGSQAWDELFGAPRPAALHVFADVGSGPRCTGSDVQNHAQNPLVLIGEELEVSLVPYWKTRKQEGGRAKRTTGSFTPV